MEWIGAALRGPAFLHSHVVRYKNILSFKSLSTVTTSALLGEIESNSLSAL